MPEASRQPFDPLKFGFEQETDYSWVHRSNDRPSVVHYLTKHPDPDTESLWIIRVHVPSQCEIGRCSIDETLYQGRIPNQEFARALLFNLGNAECRTALNLDTTPASP